MKENKFGEMQKEATRTFFVVFVQTVVHCLCNRLLEILIIVEVVVAIYVR